MRKTLVAAAMLAAGLGATTSAVAGNGTPVNPDSANVLTLAVYGDAPYGTTPTDTSEFAATITSFNKINSSKRRAADCECRAFSSAIAVCVATKYKRCDCSSLKRRASLL